MRSSRNTILCALKGRVEAKGGDGMTVYQVDVADPICRQTLRSQKSKAAVRGVSGRVPS
jgi:hypothetical protein